MEIRDLIASKDGLNSQADKILSSRTGFQSMLFITPPKLHEFKSPSPSPSPILDIMQSLNDLLADDEERKKFLHPELIKLLDGTPIQNPVPTKQFVAKK